MLLQRGVYIRIFVGLILTKTIWPEPLAQCQKCDHHLELLANTDADWVTSC